MTPEERKAIAMRHTESCGAMGVYPECCHYHYGFDAALGLLVPTAASHLWSIKAPGQP